MDNEILMNLFLWQVSITEESIEYTIWKIMTKINAQLTTCVHSL